MSLKLEPLFEQLALACEESDTANVIKISDQILQKAPGDPDATHAKVVALISTEEYARALKALDNKLLAPEIRQEFILEHAYCLYRTHQLDECLELIKRYRSERDGKLGESQSRYLTYLEGQVLYRAESFEQGFEIFSSLQNQADADERSEIIANKLAIQAAAATENVTLPEQMNTETIDSYESCYNQACIFIAEGKLQDAQKLLEAAEGKCRQALTAAEYTEEEILTELAAIELQLAYVCQLLGHTSRALKLYQGVLDKKTADAAVRLVAANNMLSISTKDVSQQVVGMVATPLTPDLEYKLTRTQRKTIAINGATLALQFKKPTDARLKARSLLKDFPGESTPYLILEYTLANPDSPELHLARAQLLILDDKIADTISALDSLVSGPENSLKYQPGLVALRVWLYGKVGSPEKAVELLEEATKVWKGKSEIPSVLKEFASYKLKNNNPRGAAADYEQLLKIDPTDTEAVAGLVIAYSEFDIPLAEQYQSYLDNDTSTLPTESSVSDLLAAFKATLRQQKPKTSLNAKKRKRKTILPKQYDPEATPDPERWLPKRDRSSYAKKGKSRRDIGRGPQGAAVAGGGIGSTGSANIKGRESVEKKETAAEAPIVEKPAAPQASPAVNKKKKKGKR
ncbi:hypothetical protein DFS34DRAFT_653144 [Phlyctochytrium arcticum]|nr:hypothetical protein DFS34DRAFT_653144 [Phlyctochytrium arcticum]